MKKTLKLSHKRCQDVADNLAIYLGFANASNQDELSRKEYGMQVAAIMQTLKALGIVCGYSHKWAIVNDAYARIEYM